MTDRIGHGRGAARMLSQALYLVLIGISIGVLVGLSLSPILGGILTSILTVILAVVSTLVGIKQPDEKTEEEKAKSEKTSKFIPPKIDLLPLAAFCLALTGGSCGGLFLRTNAILGARPNLYLQRWKESGIPENELKLRILNSISGLSPVEEKPTKPDLGAVKPDPLDPNHGKTENLDSKIKDKPSVPPWVPPVLYDSPAPLSPCGEARSQSDPLVRQQKVVALYALYRPRLANLVKKCFSEECTALSLENICPSKPQP